jgi:predicted secreted protein
LTYEKWQGMGMMGQKDFKPNEETGFVGRMGTSCWEVGVGVCGARSARSVYRARSEGSV